MKLLPAGAYTPLDGGKLETGDGARISGAQALELRGVDKAEILLFDLA
jgi:hypothetical protein